MDLRGPAAQTDQGIKIDGIVCTNHRFRKSKYLYLGKSHHIHVELVAGERWGQQELQGGEAAGLNG